MMPRLSLALLFSAALGCTATTRAGTAEASDTPDVAGVPLESATTSSTDLSSDSPDAVSSPPVKPPAGGAGDSLTLDGSFNGSAFVEILDVEYVGGLVFMCTGTKGLAVYEAGPGQGPQYLVHSGGLGVGSHGSFPRCQHVAFLNRPTDPRTEQVDVFVTNRGDETQPTPWIKWVRFSPGALQEAPIQSADLPVLATLTGALGTESYEGIFAHNGVLYAAIHKGGLAVIDTRGGTLDRVTTIPLPNHANTFDVMVTDAGTLVVATSDGGLHTFDLSDPLAPKPVGQQVSGQALTRLAAQGDIVLAAAGAGGVQIFDVSDPAAPVHLAGFETPGTVMDVNIDGDLAAVANWNDLRVLNIKDPAHPWLLAAESVPSGNGFSRVLTADIQGTAVRAGEWTALLSYTVHPENTPPDIHLAQPTLQFSPGTTAKGLLISNEGHRPLEITEALVTDKAFAVSPHEATVAPGDQAFFEVTWDGTQRQGAVRLMSNDPDEAVTDIPLLPVAATAGVGPGDPIPSNWMVEPVGSAPQPLSEIIAGKVVILAYFATF